MSVLRLAIPSPLRRHFDYLPPEGMNQDEIKALRPGQRVLVPFGRRQLTGYLLAVHDHSDLANADLKAAISVLDPAALLNSRLFELLLWSASYYHHPIGEVIAAAYPKRLRQGHATEPQGAAGWRLSNRGLGLPAGALSRSPRQAQALELLRGADAITVEELTGKGITAAIMSTLKNKGLVDKCSVTATLAPPGCAPGLELNAEQALVMKKFSSEGESFLCHLLEGVTGSGKTEVYLQCIADCLQRGKQALVLIPEIGLTPQTLERFRDRFQTPIAVLHSGLSDGPRYRAWEAARNGSARIVIGTRSAVYAPLSELGLIVIDEEHDQSYKQQDGFRYSARDVAVKRGQLENCPVILGSATPSLETLDNALAGRYLHHQLTERAGNASLPDIATIDIRRLPLQGGLSQPLIDAIAGCLADNRQCLLFLNRRGYAPALQCHDCGWVGECHQCDARLTVHRRAGRLRCHHCGASERLPSRCPSCHGGALAATGLGTEQAEEFLRRQFEHWPIFRVDSDSMQGQKAMPALVKEVNRGEAGILLGTQMLTKGHHFPAVGLVAVIDADAMLFSSDFRGEERMAQLLTQVAGRAGRAEKPGRVLLQTHYPDHPAVQAMLGKSYAEQARELLAGRHCAGLPPAGKLVITRTDCVDAELAESFLLDLRRLTENSLPAGSALIGPLPSPMQRRAGRFRSQLILTAPDRPSAQQAAGLLVAAAERLPRKQALNWTIDVDPQDVF